MSGRDRRAELLAAWQDGELGRLSGRRAARLLERSPQARRDLEVLDAVGSWVRDAHAAESTPEPDLWPVLAARLAAVDAERADAVVERGWLLRPWAASAALATAAAALVVGLLIQTTPPGDDVVQWLDGHGAPIMVLDGPDDTIIWVLESADDEISGGGSPFAA